MAEDDGAEKSFDPTPKKLEEARKKGEFPKSTDLHTAALYGGITLFLIVFAGELSSQLGLFAQKFLEAPEELSDQLLLQPGSTVLWAVLFEPFAISLPIFALPALLIGVSLIGQRAVVVAPEKIMPKLNRLSLISNAGQKFGMNGMVEFAKTSVKMSIYGAALWFYSLQTLSKITDSAALSPVAVMQATIEIITGYLLIVLLLSIVIGALDYTWQNYSHIQKNRMTRQEIMDETKQSEGDPHLKGKRRQMAQEIALSSMLKDVPDATVVVVNPTHFAVALKWKPGDPTPPVVVAKGVDEAAAQIREVAQANGVPIKSDPPVARALYATVDVGGVIDREYFAAIAAAIRFAEDIRKKAKGRPWMRKN